MSNAEQVLIDTANAAGRPEISRWLRAIAGEAHRRNLTRRERVLRYPDLAKALKAPPLSYTDPVKWTGYVPPLRDPRVDPELLHDRGGMPNRLGKRTRPSELNDSRARVALVAICREALRRDVEAGLATGEPEQDLLTRFPFPFHGGERNPMYEQAELPAPAGEPGEERADD